MQPNSSYFSRVGFFRHVGITNAGYATAAYRATYTEFTLITTAGGGRLLLTNANWASGVFSFDVLSTNVPNVTVEYTAALPAVNWTTLLTTNNPGAQILADTLDRATGELLDRGKSPSRKCGELDNRGSHFYLALCWARELATQTDDTVLAARFAPIADALGADETAIVEELNQVQGAPVDIGGYYHPDLALLGAAMRPSATFNGLLQMLRAQ